MPPRTQAAGPDARGRCPPLCGDDTRSVPRPTTRRGTYRRSRECLHMAAYLILGDKNNLFNHNMAGFVSRMAAESLPREAPKASGVLFRLFHTIRTRCQVMPSLAHSLPGYG